MNLDLSLSEQICYSTIRIETQTNRGCCTGTGFFFNFLENPDNKTHIPCIVTINMLLRKESMVFL